MNYKPVPVMRPGDLAEAHLTPEEKRWFLLVLRELQRDGLSPADAYELLGKGFYISDHNRSASLRDVINALHETSRASGAAVWKDDYVVCMMGVGVGCGLSPDEALSRILHSAAERLRSLSNPKHVTENEYE